MALEHDHGHHEEQHHPAQVGHQVDQEARTPLEAVGDGGKRGSDHGEVKPGEVVKGVLTDRTTETHFPMINYVIGLVY